MAQKTKKTEASIVNARKARMESRREANKAANDTRHRANKEIVSSERMEPRDEIREKARTDRKGTTSTYTTVHKARPSKLIRSDKRRELHELWVRAAAESGLSPAELFSLKQHLQAIAKKNLKRS